MTSIAPRGSLSLITRMVINVSQEITTLELQIPEEQRNVFDKRRVARYKFTGVIKEDASQQVNYYPLDFGYF